MTSPAIPAVLQALQLFRAPRSIRPGLDERLPDGMLTLLRVVASEEQALAVAQDMTDESAQSLREAAGFYIQQVMFSPNSHSYRVLGVDSDASDERIREHFRWLARWLHPDRNPDEWETVYSERVNRAWQHLRTPERRMRYDESLRESSDASDDSLHTSLAVVRHAPLIDEAPPVFNLRWLPKVIFVGLGVSALATVAVFYLLQRSEPSPEQVAEASQLTAAQPDSNVPSFEIAMPVPKIEDKAAAPDAVRIPIPAPVVQPHVVPAPIAAAPMPVAPSAQRVVAYNPVVRTAAPRPILIHHEPAPARALRQISAPRAPAVFYQASAATPVASAPSSRNVVATPAAPALPSVEEIDANRVLGHFSNAYAEGNLDGMRAMFTADASSPLGGLRAILADYHQLFESSHDRLLVVRDVSWFTSGNTFTIIASYQATVTSARNRRPRRTHGDLRLDLRREDEQWRIYRLLHDERPG